jgi:hypothetical protein
MGEQVNLTGRNYMRKIKAKVSKRVERAPASKKIGAWKGFWRKYFSF